MNAKTPQQLYRQQWSGVVQKDLRQVLLHELYTRYGFGEMKAIAEPLVDRILELVRTHTSAAQPLGLYEFLALAVSPEARLGPGRTIQENPLVLVKLSLLSQEERYQLAQGCSWSGLQHDRAARLLKEAYAQGGVLSFTDLALLTGKSVAGISYALQRYYQEHPEEETLPHMGTIFDMGRTVTHKREAVWNWLQGLLTQESAQQMDHHPLSVDRYVRDFQRVLALWMDGKEEEQIAFLSNLARSVVREYLALIEEYSGELRRGLAEFEEAWQQAQGPATTGAGPG